MSMTALADQLDDIYARCDGCKYLIYTPRYSLPFCGYKLATGQALPIYDVSLCTRYTQKEDDMKLDPEKRKK